jgi:hypothetical protein
VVSAGHVVVAGGSELAAHSVVVVLGRPWRGCKCSGGGLMLWRWAVPRVRIEPELRKRSRGRFGLSDDGRCSR